MAKFLTPADVAEQLACCETTAIERMMEMNPVNVGTSKRRQLRVTQIDLDAWIARHRMSYIIDHAPEKPERKRRPPVMVADQYTDEYGRCLRKRNGQLVPMARPPRQ